MSVFARIVVGVDGTDWGFEALRQALLLAPTEKPSLHAVTALDTAPAIHAGFEASHITDLLAGEAQESRLEAEAIIAGREGFEARVVRGRPVDVLRHERDELQATLMALGGDAVAASSAFCWATPARSSCTTRLVLFCSRARPTIVLGNRARSSSGSTAQHMPARRSA